jgi:RNA polymerase sigma-70 factor (ECF subfamily)
VKGESGAEAAQALGMKVATVFVARSKVQKMLQEEIRKLEEPEDADPDHLGSPTRMNPDQ